MPAGQASPSLATFSGAGGSEGVAASRFGLVSEARAGCVGCAGCALRGAVSTGSRSIVACVRAGAAQATTPTIEKTPKIVANRIAPKGSAVAYISQIDRRSRAQPRGRERAEKRAQRAAGQDEQPSFSYTFPQCSGAWD
jgi:hypothetical protein